MSERTELDPPPTEPLEALLARNDPSAARELAALTSSLLAGEFIRSDPNTGFAVRTIDLRRSSPSFPSAAVVADSLDPSAPLTHTQTLDLDRDAFVSTPVLLFDGRAYSVSEVLELGAAADDAAPAAMKPAINAGVRSIARVVLDALRAAGPSLRDLRPLIAHHTVPAGASVFVAREAALNTLGIDAQLRGGLTWAMAMKLVPARASRHRVAYEVGDVSPEGLLFTVHTAEDELHVLARMGTGPVLEVAASVPHIFDRFVKLVAVLQLAPTSQLRLWVDDVLVGSARGGSSPVARLVGRQTIGAGVLGRHRSALFLRELILVGGPIGSESLDAVSRRFDRHTRGAR